MNPRRPRLKRWFPTFIAIYRWWRNRLTTPGRLVVAAVLISIPGVVGEQPMSLQLFSMLLLTLITAASLGRIFMPRLHGTIHSPSHVRSGRPLELRVHLENRSRRPCYDLTLAMPLNLRQEEQWELLEIRFESASLAPGESASGTIVVRPLRRGRRRYPLVRVVSTFPLNLMHFRQTITSAADVIVTPDFLPLEQFDLTPRGRGDIRADSSVHSTGDSWEYCGSREYQVGLPVRRWDYGAWARHAQPAVREFEEFTQATCLLLVDTFVDDAKAGERRSAEQRVEEVLSLAASLVDALCREQWQIQLLATDSEEPWRRAEGNWQQLDPLMERLAVAGTEREPYLGCLAVAAFSSASNLRDMTVFVALSGWDAEREALCLELSRHCDDLRLLMPAGTTTAPPRVARPKVAPQRPLAEASS